MTGSAKPEALSLTYEGAAMVTEAYNQSGDIVV